MLIKKRGVPLEDRPRSRMTRTLKKLWREVSSKLTCGVFTLGWTEFLLLIGQREEVSQSFCKVSALILGRVSPLFRADSLLCWTELLLYLGRVSVIVFGFLGF